MAAGSLVSTALKLLAAMTVACAVAASTACGRRSEDGSGAAGSPQNPAPEPHTFSPRELRFDAGVATVRDVDFDIGRDTVGVRGSPPSTDGLVVEPSSSAVVRFRVPASLFDSIPRSGSAHRDATISIDHGGDAPCLVDVAVAGSWAVRNLRVDGPLRSDRFVVMKFGQAVFERHGPAASVEFEIRPHAGTTYRLFAVGIDRADEDRRERREIASYRASVNGPSGAMEVGVAGDADAYRLVGEHTIGKGSALTSSFSLSALPDRDHGQFLALRVYSSGDSSVPNGGRSPCAVWVNATRIVGAFDPGSLGAHESVFQIDGLLTVGDNQIRIVAGETLSDAMVAGITVFTERARKTGLPIETRPR